MALLSVNAVHDIFKAHLAGPTISVSAGGDQVTFDMPSLTCPRIALGKPCDGGVKVMVKTTTVVGKLGSVGVKHYQCKKCAKNVAKYGHPASFFSIEGQAWGLALLHPDQAEDLAGRQMCFIKLLAKLEAVQYHTSWILRLFQVW